VPAAGWDDDGFSGIVDGHLALGYACPAPPDDSDPAAIVDERPPAEDDDDPTARSLVRELGDASPPPEAVGPSVDADRSATADSPGTESPPPAVTEWLDAVAKRLARADRLAEATSVTEAADAVETVGGADEVCTLRDQLAADREALAAVATRCQALAEDADAVEIPVETLARLA
jgi:hypothetical protein